MDPANLPHVDILIATFNEPLDVLERTIIGACTLDWPADKLHVYVLDDGQRDWLEAYAARKGIGYLTRTNNIHAKAGNINAALQRTSSEFFMILDADFIPQHKMLYRMVGFFEDPKVGIVQVPHDFFNFDPLQTNLAMRASMPSDQKMFFREIMRGRDGWNCAFCCGSNSITRRTAMEEIGGAMPTGSITEDMLLTLAFLRKGYVTRYLAERLAIGLAPESLDAFFVQRSRWAQGALQILYLKEGPLGPGLRLHERLMFMPTHWLTQSLMQVMSLVLPITYLLFGFIPMVNTTVEDLFYYQFPLILATILALRRLAPDAYFPLPATVLATLQSFRFLPMLLKTLVKPHGHKFRVTPKGSDADGRAYDGYTVRLCLVLIVLTSAGFLLNIWSGKTQADAQQLFPIVTIWSTINALVIGVVLTVAFARPVPRKEERFLISEPATIWRQTNEKLPVQLVDLSLSGAQFTLEGHDLGKDEWVRLDIAGIGPIIGTVLWTRRGATGLKFYHASDVSRDALIARIFANCAGAIPTEDKVGNITADMLGAIFKPNRSMGPMASAEPTLPPKEVLAWHASSSGVADSDLDLFLWEHELGTDGTRTARDQKMAAEDMSKQETDLGLPDRRRA
nr:glycosyltransferase [Actibacterium sp. 188UL27-1]